MKSIIQRIEKTQQRLSQDLQRADLENIYGRQEGKRLWNSYRNQKRDIWGFYCSLEKEEQKLLFIWIQSKLAEY